MSRNKEPRFRFILNEYQENQKVNYLEFNSFFTDHFAPLFIARFKNYLSTESSISKCDSIAGALQSKLAGVPEQFMEIFH